MSEITALTELLTRLRQGDVAAREELADRMYARVVDLSRHILRTGSAHVQRWEQTEDLAHSAWFRIQRAIEDKELQFESPSQLLRLAARHIRFEIIGMHRRYKTRGSKHHTQAFNTDSNDASEANNFVANETADPQKAIAWAEFHEAVEQLPEEQKEIVELLWYQGLDQEAVACLIGISLRQVKRRWRDAKLSLSSFLDPTLID